MLLGRLKHNFANKEALISSSDHKGAVNGRESFTHLVVAVPDDGQVEELAPMLLGQDGVNAGSMRAAQLLVDCQIIGWWGDRELAQPSEPLPSVAHRVSAYHSNRGKARGCEPPFLQGASWQGLNMRLMGRRQPVFRPLSSLWLPVCGRAGDAAARRRHQHCVSFFSQADPLLHQPSFTLHILLRLLWTQRARSTLTR